MKKVKLLLLALFISGFAFGQKHQGKFEQLGTTLPTANSYRTASGAPGHAYWQQKADYDIAVELDDAKQTITGVETITYHNNSPDELRYLWVQLDQNVRAKDSNTPLSRVSTGVLDSIPAKFLQQGMADFDYDGGFKITFVKDANGNMLSYVINKTMMRVDLPKPIKSKGSFKFSIKWSFNINDRMLMGGRGGYEYFPKDDNYLYTIAQWFPRMAAYYDVEGWQNKQFLGNGEFTLTFGDYDVRITVPSDHIIAATGELQNAQEVLTTQQYSRFQKAKTSFDKLVIIATQKEAEERETKKANTKSTWVFHADNVRDFAFASSRKFIWDGMAVKINDKTPLAMSYYPKEGNPLWEKESTKAVVKTLITYSKYTIDYPYSKAISVHAASIGMEYPMICFNFGRPNEDGTYTDQLKYGMIGVIIHEVGHNFFPMIINSDERQWTWMDEGLNTFVQFRTEQEAYDNFPSRRGPAAKIVPYMKGDQSFISPIMTNSEQIKQFGNNAYGKPATALNILRETIMGPELFDYAFKEYARRWAFKSPTPADLFRTMEDASAVDLDWFWKGWFYTTDYVDIAIDDVKWFKTKQPEQPTIEKKRKRGKIKHPVTEEVNVDAKNNDFSKGYKEFTLTDTDPIFYGEYQNRIDDKSIRKRYADKNFYEVTFKNKGGLLMPIILEFTYKDGTKERNYIPAEIWRKNETEVKKVFMKDKEVMHIQLDPSLETADTNVEDNVFPKVKVDSKFDKFKKKN